MNGWMSCDFTSFSTVFQSYQDDERLIMRLIMIMKCNGTPFGIILELRICLVKQMGIILEFIFV